MPRPKSRRYSVTDLPSWLSPPAPEARDGRLVRPLFRPEDALEEEAAARRGRGTEKLLEYNRKRAEEAFARDGLTPDERERKRMKDKRKREREKRSRKPISKGSRKRV